MAHLFFIFTLNNSRAYSSYTCDPLRHQARFNRALCFKVFRRRARLLITFAKVYARNDIVGTCVIYVDNEKLFFTRANAKLLTYTSKT